MKMKMKLKMKMKMTMKMKSPMEMIKGIMTMRKVEKKAMLSNFWREEVNDEKGRGQE